MIHSQVKHSEHVSIVQLIVLPFTTVLPKIPLFQVRFQLRPFCVKFPCPPSANSCDVVDFHSPNPCMWSWLEACPHGMSMGTGSCPWCCPSCPQEPAGRDPSSLNGNKRTDGTTSVNPFLIVTLQGPTVWPTREISSARLPGTRIAEWPRDTPLSTSTKESCLPANRWLLISAAIYVSAQEASMSEACNPLNAPADWLVMAEDFISKCWFLPIQRLSAPTPALALITANQ